jgi:hypothetical protein
MEIHWEALKVKKLVLELVSALAVSKVLHSVDLKEKHLVLTTANYSV